MSDTTAAPLTPSRMRSILTLMMAVAAALLYAAILGVGILRTFGTEGVPSFPPGMERLASALCGLMGTIVRRVLPAAAAGQRHPLRRHTRWRRCLDRLV